MSTSDSGHISQNLSNSTDYLYDETVITVHVLSTKSSEMNQVDRIESIIRGALDKCPEPQNAEEVSMTISISEFKFTIDRRRIPEPAKGEDN